MLYIIICVILWTIDKISILARKSYEESTQSDERGQVNGKTINNEKKVEGKKVLIGDDVAAQNDDDSNLMISKTAKIPGNEDTRANVNSDVAGTGDGKTINIEEKVEGKNVLIGNDVAVVSDGRNLTFTEPLQNDDDSNLMISKTAKIPGNEETRASVNSDVAGTGDGKLIGNDVVNIQHNEQNIFVAGDTPGKIEVDTSGEPEAYSRAKPDDVDELIKQGKATAANDEEPLSISEDKSVNRSTIQRIANLYQEKKDSKAFMALCDSLKDLTARQRRSLAPILCGIESIDLTDAKIDLCRLSAFYDCFGEKTFDQVLLRNRYISAKDIQVLASSLGSCKVKHLDMGFCSFETMAFLKMTDLLPRVDCLIFRRLILLEKMSTSVSAFSACEAKQFSLSILDCDRSFQLKLFECNLSDVGTASEFSKCLTKIHSFAFKHSIVSKMGFTALISGISKMHTIDLTGVNLRNIVPAEIAALFTQVKILILNDVFLTDSMINKLLTQIEKLPNIEMEAIDLSNNEPCNKTVSRILANVGKVKVFAFTKKRLNFTKYNDEIDQQEKVLISREEKNESVKRKLFDHWMCTVKPNTEHVRNLITEIALTDQEEMDARYFENYICKNCKRHIAFKRDEIKYPFYHLHKDRSKLLKYLSSLSYISVSWTSACVVCCEIHIPHDSLARFCALNGYEIYPCKCAACDYPMGLVLCTDTENIFWSIFQEYRVSNEVGQQLLFKS